ncbi:MAG: CPBP family intramembrane metalloprotease [Caulobacter sp.]|nr:CPBP family intramembrane metalloprotease [Caulobacter sp.]
MTLNASRWPVATGVLIALGGVALVVLLRDSGVLSPDPLQQRLWAALGLWGVMATIIVLMILVERQPFTSVGLGPPRLSSLAWGLLFGVVGFLSFPVCLLVLKGMHLSPPDPAAYRKLAALPLWLRALTVLTAGVTEEFLFRGYAISRLKSLTGSTTWAALISGAVFIVLHLSAWGASQLLFVGVATVLMTGLFLWRGDLWSNIVAHLFIDGVPMLLLGLAPPP